MTKLDAITARIRARQARIRDRIRMRRARVWAPLRDIVGERLVDGQIHSLLACGHTVRARLTKRGDWANERRKCVDCSLHTPPRVEVRIDASGLDVGDWSEEIGT